MPIFLQLSCVFLSVACISQAAAEKTTTPLRIPYALISMLFIVLAIYIEVMVK